MTPAEAHNQYERTIEENDELFAFEDYDRVSDLVQEGNFNSIYFILFHFIKLFCNTKLFIWICTSY